MELVVQEVVRVDRADPAQHHRVVVLFGVIVQERTPLHRHDLHRDVQRLEFGLNELRDVDLRLVVGPDLNGHGKAFAHSRIDHELLGLGNIVDLYLAAGVGPTGGRNGSAVDRSALAEQRGLDDHVAVQGVRHRLAHLDVVEGLFGEVQSQVVIPGARAAHQRHAGRFFEQVHLILRHPDGEVHSSGLHVGDPGHVVFQRLEDQLVHVGPARLPIVGIALQRHAVTGHPAYEPERPGPHRRLDHVVALGVAARHDAHASCRNLRQERRIGFFQSDHDGGGAGSSDRRHLAEIVQTRRGGLRVENPFERVHHVLGSQRRSIGELDPWPQREGVNQTVLRHAVLLRHRRRDFALWRHGQQGVVDLLGHVGRRGGRIGGRIESDDVGLLGHREGASARLCCARPHDQQQRDSRSLQVRGLQRLGHQFPPE